MENKIELLKDLRLAYIAAINYDHVPDKSQAKELIEDYPEFKLVSQERLEQILDRFEGSSDGNITNKIIDLIDEL